MQTRQDYQDAYNEWVEEYKPGEFIEYSPEEYEALKQSTDTRLVWTQHGTCETERYSNGLLEFSGRGCGCWQTFGWVVCEKPWEGNDDTLLIIDTEWYGPCETCNADGEDKNIAPECPECDGEGYTQYYFD